MIPWFAEALARGALVALAGLAVWACLARSSAAARHLALTCTLFVLAALPFMNELGPRISIAQDAPLAAGSPRLDEGWAKVARGGPVPAPVELPAAEAEVPTPKPDASRALPSVLAGAAALVYSLVAAILLLRLAAGHAWAMLLWVRGQATTNQKVRLSPSVGVPVALPFIKGILAPLSWSQWQHEERLAALLHEQGHLSRRDGLTQAVGQVAAALNWPNPLAWIIAGLQRREAELATDDLALSGMPALDYAAALVAHGRRLGKRSRLSGLLKSAAMPFGSSSLKRRIARLTQSGACRKPVGAAALGLGAALGIAATAAASLQTIPVPRRPSPDSGQFRTERLPAIGSAENGFAAVLADTRTATLERIIRFDDRGRTTEWAPDGTPLKPAPGPWTRLRWTGSMNGKGYMITRLATDSDSSMRFGGMESAMPLPGEPLETGESRPGEFEGTITFGGATPIGMGAEARWVDIVYWEGPGDWLDFGFTWSDGPWSTLASIPAASRTPVGHPSTAVITHIGAPQSQSLLRHRKDTGPLTEVVVRFAEGFDDAVRVVALDKAGREMETRVYASGRTKGRLMVTARWPVALAGISRFEVNWRPVFRTRFERVAARPRSAGSPGVR